MIEPLPDTTFEERIESLKFVRFLAADHRVRTSWAAWIISQFVEEAPEGYEPPACSDMSFDALDDEGKFDRIERLIPEGYMPAAWLSWLIDRFVPDFGPPGQNRTLH